ncbi:MAG: hypothetical protein ACNA71_02385 [Kiritimatiellia bacterium]
MLPAKGFAGRLSTVQVDGIIRCVAGLLLARVNTGAGRDGIAAKGSGHRGAVGNCVQGVHLL